MDENDQNSSIVKKRECKPKPNSCHNISVNKIVLCKVRGFCEWPARVVGIKNNEISVEFFGDHSTKTTSAKNIFAYEESIDFIMWNLKNKKDRGSFYNAILEVEKEMKILPGI